MAYRNIEDQRAASRRHYLENKVQYLDRNKLYRQKIQQFIQQVKSSTPCADCGTKYPYYVMDFDHLDGKNKVNTINYLASTGRIGAVKSEIQKCELVCANCHRIRTHNRRVNRLHLMHP